MKNNALICRFACAFSGIYSAARSESSFRLQIVAAVAVIVFLCWRQPSAIWWAVVALTIGAVLAAELFNTALERVIDHLHPASHPLIKVAKDCAAGGVLVLSLAAIAVFVALIMASF